MNFKPIQVACDCGHFSTLDSRSIFCEKCGRRIFYNPKDRRSHKLNNIYVLSMVLGVITFLTYIFIEMIATPLM